MKGYQLRIFLDYGVDHRLLVSITQKPSRDFYMAPGHSGDPHGAHFSWHRSGIHKIAGEFGNTPRPTGQPIDQINAWEPLFTAQGTLGPPEQRKPYTEKTKHSRAVRIDVSQFGPAFVP
jgi:hypothetical protein